MKPIFIFLLPVLAVSHTFGFYLQNAGHGSTCGCGGSIVDIPIHQLPVAEQPSDDDGTRYKFNFGIQQPRASDTEPQLNSYGYQIQEPSEPKVDNTKYKYDYTLQQPMDEKVIESPKPTMHTKIDRMIQDQPECSCRHDSPCTCGYSPEQCAMHCNAGRIANNNAYVLPVRYNNGGDYVVYEFPQEESTRYLHRTARQAPTSDTSISDHIRTIATALRERTSKLISANSGSDRVGSTLGSTLGATLSSAFDSTLGATANSTSGARKAIDVTALKEKFTTMAEPFVSKAGQLIGGMKESFLSARSKRDVGMDAEHHNSKTAMPMLRVREYDPSRDQSRYAKYMHMARVQLQTPEHHEMDMKEMEKASHCHSCGSTLMDSVCSRCGTYQPQYIEYIEGKQVPFYPGAVQESKDHPTADSAAATRYIFDRYGHKYLENNGKLRLVRNQPDYAGLADILEQNHSMMQQLNPNPGRLVAQPVDIVSDLTKLVRELARGSTNSESRNQEKRSTEPLTEDQPRSMYQVVPMQYDGKDGKLVVKIYDNNKKMDGSAAPKPMNDESDQLESIAEDQTNMMERTPPTVKKFVKNNKEFEILTFNDYKGTSDDDIRRVLEHLHGGQQW